MKQNNLSLLEISELIKEIKEETNNFIFGLKSSMWVEKDGNIQNPDFVHMRFFDPKEFDTVESPKDIAPFYSITLDCKYTYQLENDKVVLAYIEDEEKEHVNRGEEILKMNMDTLEDSLVYLNSNKPQYFVTYSNKKGYMNFDQVDGSVYIEGNQNRINIYKPNINFNYDIKNDLYNFVLDNGTEITLDEKNSEGKFTNYEELYAACKDIFESIQIKQENLPDVLLNKLKSQNKEM